MNGGQNPLERIAGFLGKLKGVSRGDAGLLGASALIPADQNDDEKALRAALNSRDSERVQASLDALRRRTPPNMMALLLDRLLADCADAALLSARAAAARDENRPDEELRFLRRAVAADEATVGTWIELIHATARDGRLPAALEVAEPARAKFPDDPRLALTVRSLRRRRDLQDLAQGRYREVVESTLAAGNPLEFAWLLDQLYTGDRAREADMLLAAAGIDPRMLPRPADDAPAPPASDMEIGYRLELLRGSGDLDAAQRLAADWLRAHAVSMPLRVPLGRLYLDLGRYPEAAELLLDAGDEWTVRDKVADLRENDAAADAEKLVREALRRRPGSLGLLQQAGLTALADRRYDQALRDAARMLEINPRSFDAFEIRFEALAAGYQHEAIDRDLEHVLTTYPHVADFLMVAADALRRRRRLPEAEEKLRAAIAMLPPDRHAYPRQVLAEVLIDLRRPAEAIPILADLIDRAAAQGTSDIGLREDLALAHLFGNDLPAARAEAAAVLDRDGQRAMAYGVLGYTYISTGEYEVAESWFRRAQDPRTGESRQPILLAMALLEQDDERRFGEIRDLCAQARRADERDPEPIAVLGMLSLKEGDEAAAEQQLRRSIELGGLDGYAPLGALLVREGRFDEAERVFERGLAATYGDPELRTELANLHLQRGQLGPAAELFGALVGADPYNGLAVVGLAMALTGKVPPDLGQAEALLTGALRRDTRYRDRVLIVLGYVVAQRGDPDCEAEALSLVDAAIEHHPVAEYHLYAARLRAYRGDFRGALRAVGVVQRIAPDDPRAAELGRQIVTYRRDRLRQRLAARRGQYVAAVAAILLAALWTVHLRTGVDTAVLLSVSGFLATVVLVGFLMPNPRVEQFSAGGFRVGAGPPGAPELPPIRTGIPLPALRLSASVLPPAPSAPRKRAVQYTAHGTGIESGLTPRNNDWSA